MSRKGERESTVDRFADALPGLVWTALPNGEVDFVNRRWCEFTGLTAAESRGRGWLAAIHPDDVGALTESWQAALTAGTSLDTDARMRGDGIYRWFLFRANPTRDDAGKIIKWHGTNIDIHNRKRVDEELRRSEAFLAEGQRLSSTGSFTWNMNSDVLTLSGECRRIFDFARDGPVTPERIADRIHPEDRPAWREKERRARAGSAIDFEVRLLMPGGSIKYLHLIAYPGRDLTGRPELFGVVQDMTERRLSDDALGRVRSELARVARVTSLGQLTASIAHEINQPLSGISINAGLCLRMLTNDPPDIEGALQTARRTIRDVERASDVIARLRVLFLKGSGATEAVDLSAATDEVITLLSSELQRQGVISRTELADNLPPVTGDRVQLQQVITNLIMNASEAMSGIDDRPRELTVTTARDENDYVRMTVRDSGPGVDPKEFEKIFEAFYTTKTGGMGIGLSVSRSIIESHHGKLWAASNTEHGAAISFCLPPGIR
jgi:PAS domain S-box-containing protein